MTLCFLSIVPLDWIPFLPQQKVLQCCAHLLTTSQGPCPALSIGDAPTKGIPHCSCSRKGHRRPQNGQTKTAPSHDLLFRLMFICLGSLDSFLFDFVAPFISIQPFRELHVYHCEHLLRARCKKRAKNFVKQTSDNGFGSSSSSCKIRPAKAMLLLWSMKILTLQQKRHYNCNSGERFTAPFQWMGIVHTLDGDGMDLV